MGVLLAPGTQITGGWDPSISFRRKPLPGGRARRGGDFF